jgi:hypothetical protein
VYGSVYLYVFFLIRSSGAFWLVFPYPTVELNPPSLPVFFLGYLRLEPTSGSTEHIRVFAVFAGFVDGRLGLVRLLSETSRYKFGIYQSGEKT